MVVEPKIFHDTKLILLPTDIFGEILRIGFLLKFLFNSNDKE